MNEFWSMDEAARVARETLNDNGESPFPAEGVVNASEAVCTVEFVAENYFGTQISLTHFGVFEAEQNVSNAMLDKALTYIPMRQVPKDELELVLPGAKFLSQRVWTETDAAVLFEERISFDPLEISASSLQEADHHRE